MPEPIEKPVSWMFGAPLVTPRSWAWGGEIGHVDDFLIGESSWKIRYLLVDTSNWIGGKSVVVAAEALEGVDTDKGMLKVGATREAVRHSPKFESIEDAIGPAENGPPFVII